jgi:hypothetical protein
MSLQKFTESDIRTLPAGTDEKYRTIILRIINGEQVDYEAKYPMPGVAGEDLTTAADLAINYLKGEAWDAFYESQQSLFSEDTRGQIWLANQYKIRNVIADFISKNGRLPTHDEISNRTNLSRQTIHKHLKTFDQSEQYKTILAKYRFMSTKILDRLYSLAMGGDTKAAKLYLQIVGGVPGMANQFNPITNQQNNFIQVNGMMLTEDVIDLLSPTQLNQLEKIVRLGIKKKVELKRIDSSKQKQTP